jgi:hypothetical protein
MVGGLLWGMIFGRRRQSRAPLEELEGNNANGLEGKWKERAGEMDRGGFGCPIQMRNREGS